MSVLIIAALGFPLIRGVGEHQKLEAEREVVRQRIDRLESELHTGDRLARQILARRLEYFDSLSESAERGMDAFAELQEKYGKLEPRGDGVVSLRSIPQVNLDGRLAPRVFRIWIPEERNVWLHYGVVPSGKAESVIRGDAELVSDGRSRLEDEGPFQLKLSPGAHDFCFRVRKAKDERLPIEIELDGSLIFATAYAHPKVTSMSMMSMAMRRQVDYPTSRPLPMLLKGGFQLAADASSSDRQEEHDVVVWLGEQSGQAESFPQSRTKD
jgi:hypothetical protein